MPYYEKGNGEKHLYAVLDARRAISHSGKKKIYKSLVDYYASIRAWNHKKKLFTRITTNCNQNNTATTRAVYPLPLMQEDFLVILYISRRSRSLRWVFWYIDWQHRWGGDGRGAKSNSSGRCIQSVRIPNRRSLCSSRTPCSTCWTRRCYCRTRPSIRFQGSRQLQVQQKLTLLVSNWRADRILVTCNGHIDFTI